MSPGFGAEMLLRSFFVLQFCCFLFLFFFGCLFLSFKDPSRVDFCPSCLTPPWQPAAHLRDLDWKVQSFVLFVSFCGTIALKAEIVCLVGRRDKTKFDLAPPGLDLELPVALASTYSHCTAFSWAFQRGEVVLCAWAQGPRVGLLPALPVPRFSIFTSAAKQPFPFRTGSGRKLRKIVVRPRKQPGSPFLNITFGLGWLVLSQLDKLSHLRRGNLT